MFVVVMCAVLLAVAAGSNIYDPLEVFCGSVNCYEVLGLAKDCTTKDIKKAYRQLSKTYHPDKNKDPGATETFRKLTKAHDVLISDESRLQFDKYLNREISYFQVSGQHYAKNLPKSDVRLVIVVAIGLITWLLHTVQYQKYERVIKYLRNATLRNLDARNGGSPQTQELHKRACDQYDEHIKELRAGGDKLAGRGGKREEDPIFIKMVEKLVSEVKIEGGYRKPEWSDLFAVRLVLSPYHFIIWCMKYYRRNISTAPLSLEDRTEMARDRVGLAEWEEVLTEEEKQKLIEREIWKQDVYEQWIEEQVKEAEAAAEAAALVAEAMNGKGSKKLSKKKLRRQLQKQVEEDMDADD